MGKSSGLKNFVIIERRKKQYRFYTEDIKTVYTLGKKKHPKLPRYDNHTCDETYEI